MALFSKRCLEELRERVDLCEIISSYVPMKRAGASYKGLCPFHNEKTPSFIIQKGDTHYHCFGCGAHGDAMAFLMHYLKLSFVEAVEMLAGRFGVTLEYEQGEETKSRGPDLAPLKAALNTTRDFFHFHLLHTEEGKRALHYLAERGLDLSFVKQFRIGLSPTQEAFSMTFFREHKIPEEVLLQAGLAKQSSRGHLYPFFSGRIMFPIEDISGNAIGFSGRALGDQARGGKYINTPETPLFKKSRVLFGLNHSRKRIAKEQKAIIVEGQIDALCLIQAGLNLTVAGQGTAFGSGHVDVLKKLGITHVYLAFDGDAAGRSASLKVGQLFQKEGIEVLVVCFEENQDPDTLLRTKGVEKLLELLKGGISFIPFVIEVLSAEGQSNTPAGKNRIAKQVERLIREWEHPVMVHEGLKQLAHLLNVPQELVNPEGKPPVHLLPSKKTPTPSRFNVDRVIECDLIRWLLVMGNEIKGEILALVENNLVGKSLRDPLCDKLFWHAYNRAKEGQTVDIFDLASLLSKEEEGLLEQIVQKKVNVNKAKEGMQLAIQKILERGWMIEREQLKQQIQKGEGSEDEILALAKKFDLLKKEKPEVIV